MATLIYRLDSEYFSWSSGYINGKKKKVAKMVPQNVIWANFQRNGHECVRVAFENISLGFMRSIPIQLHLNIMQDKRKCCQSPMKNE
jgi:hypothetical protein